MLGSIIRLVSAVPLIPESWVRQMLLHLGFGAVSQSVLRLFIAGSVVVASAQSFFLVLPCKIAEYWFPEKQRALANVLTFIGMIHLLFGVCAILD